MSIVNPRAPVPALRILRVVGDDTRILWSGSWVTGRAVMAAMITDVCTGGTVPTRIGRVVCGVRTWPSCDAEV